ncbi:MAG: ABC transporter substrate-binding protein [Rubrivivax sp.]
MSPASLPRRRCLQALGAVAAGTGFPAPGQPALDKVTVLTSWFAQAEHGGVFQAAAAGIYRKHGLEVTVRTGGPQINGIQLLLAGEVDFSLNRDFAVLSGVERGYPLVTVAAPMQWDSTGILAHEQVQGLSDLKDKTILIASTAHLYWWPWLKAKYGYTDAQSRPYTSNLQPFFADKNIVQQAVASAEPYQAAEKGVKAKFFPFARDGYPPYHGAITTVGKNVAERADMVQRLVRATLEGWKSFLADPAPAAEAIKKANPNMTDGEIAFGLRYFRESKVLTGGDAAQLGIGAMTDERWQKTRDFMVEYGLLKPTTDWTKAYTLRFVRDLRIMA